MLRLFTRIGELLAFTELDNNAIAVLQRHIHRLLAFIGKPSFKSMFWTSFCRDNFVSCSKLSVLPSHTSLLRVTPWKILDFRQLLCCSSRVLAPCCTLNQTDNTPTRPSALSTCTPRSSYYAVRIRPNWPIQPCFVRRTLKEISLYFTESGIFSF